MNPPDANSSLAALRQLKEMLDAGTITPSEFDTLKSQLIFGVAPALPLAGPPEAAPPLPEVPAPLPETTLAAYDTAAPNPFDLPPPPASDNPDWLAAAAPSLLPGEPALTYPPEADAEPERRNPLNLVFIVGGVLVLLGIVLYLFLDRPNTPDEHLTSASQTAADSTTAVPEIGPQAEQITLPPAAPETIRVAPVVRPQPAVSQVITDSAAVASPSPAATTGPASKAPAIKVPAATPAASPAVADSAAKAP